MLNPISNPKCLGVGGGVDLNLCNRNTCCADGQLRQHTGHKSGTPACTVQAPTSGPARTPNSS